MLDLIYSEYQIAKMLFETRNSEVDVTYWYVYALYHLNRAYTKILQHYLSERNILCGPDTDLVLLMKYAKVNGLKHVLAKHSLLNKLNNFSTLNDSAVDVEEDLFDLQLYFKDFLNLYNEVKGEF